MALVKLPLMGLDASSQLGKAIVYSKWKGRNYVRKLVKPSNPKSALQTGMRSSLSFMSKSYAALAAATKTNWLAQYKKKAITALNSYVRFNQPRIRMNLGITQDPTFVPGAVEVAPTALVATAGTRNIKLVWVDSAGANDTATFIYRAIGAAPVVSVATLVQVIPHGTQLWTDVKVKTGTQYFYIIGGNEKGGTLGTVTASVNGTPT